jgi:hypothetical protein
VRCPEDVILTKYVCLCEMCPGWRSHTESYVIDDKYRNLLILMSCKWNWSNLRTHYDSYSTSKERTCRFTYVHLETATMKQLLFRTGKQRICSPSNPVSLLVMWVSITYPVTYNWELYVENVPEHMQVSIHNHWSYAKKIKQTFNRKKGKFTSFV